MATKDLVRDRRFKHVDSVNIYHSPKSRFVSNQIKLHEIQVDKYRIEIHGDSSAISGIVIDDVVSADFGAGYVSLVGSDFLVIDLPKSAFKDDNVSAYIGGNYQNIDAFDTNNAIDCIRTSVYNGNIKTATFGSTQTVYNREYEGLLALAPTKDTDSFKLSMVLASTALVIESTDSELYDNKYTPPQYIDPMLGRSGGTIDPILRRCSINENRLAVRRGISTSEIELKLW